MRQQINKRGEVAKHGKSCAEWFDSTFQNKELALTRADDVESG